ncbi:type II toxin-antitoxin system RelB/DinJ family antitoxin [Lactobacillus iners]|uniref:type II toxin-antitoxin system RelB/DinJ family antitoxin n=1 Tax=Lactobacillus iners TaxID=147802 RepID=UPI001F0969C7|nr:type II toxin-antitoxin system RelB/DinJ family antitoxin [Lactobacillus iners]MCT7669296.1 type II toxin-antitoxin system RelB/DinJ family antitoxin [Lactobacillus iners]MCT7736636.1 type II toxin-antitoxin system RelB/DinJ family antitoxin [Lactobacillus iners]MCT7815060.1 type II toxin-antitoxin system RelB/DinJ family antitoxin [Lactobacillus iners]
MAKTASINVRIEPEVKQQAEDLFGSFGISVTDAINIFLHTSIMEGGFPFTIRQPRFNAETLAMQEARDIMSGKIQAKSYKTTDNLLQALNAED